MTVHQDADKSPSPSQEVHREAQKLKDGEMNPATTKRPGRSSFGCLVCCGLFSELLLLGLALAEPLERKPDKPEEGG